MSHFNDMQIGNRCCFDCITIFQADIIADSLNCVYMDKCSRTQSALKEETASLISNTNPSICHPHYQSGIVITKEFNFFMLRILGYGAGY